MLRTAAPGADRAFQAGAEQAAGRVELYLPWPRFGGFEQATLLRPTRRAYEIAAEHHPAWEGLGRGAGALHARNSHQVLGRGLDRPCASVVCWTADGRSMLAGDGGRDRPGAAYRFALRRAVFSLGVDEHRDRVLRFAAA